MICWWDNFFFSFVEQNASKQINLPKNRYSNILPPDHSRVLLPTMLNKVGSDYINANWVDGIDQRSQRKFIATQGPLPNTVEDFWRMVWTYKCSVIVMLTALYESNRQMIKKKKGHCFHLPLKKGKNAFNIGQIKKRHFRFMVCGVWKWIRKRKRVNWRNEFSSWPKFLLEKSYQ